MNDLLECINLFLNFSFKFLYLRDQLYDYLLDFLILFEWNLTFFKDFFVLKLVLIWLIIDIVDIFGFLFDICHDFILNSTNFINDMIKLFTQFNCAALVVHLQCRVHSAELTIMKQPIFGEGGYKAWISDIPWYMAEYESS